MSGVSQHHFAYVFERFPTFTQTFCVREVMELERQGLRPLLVSIRDTREESNNQFPEALRERVNYLPQGDALREEVMRMKEAGELTQGALLTLRHWGDRPDKKRVYEACWVGALLKKHGVVHAHAHFAGLSARTLWWVRKFYGIDFSFTGHANDIFREDEFEVSLGHLVRDAALVVTVSDFSRRGLMKRFVKSWAKLHRVYNGLDLSPFEPEVEARGLSSGGILAVGRLIEKKGYPDLVRACGILKEKAVKFHCRIIGDGPMREELEEQIADAGLEDCVELLGERDQGEIARLLKEETQVFCLPCVVEEDGGMDNLPTVIMEAMAAGVPCVSTVLAGVPEMIEHGESGWLVEPGDFEGVAEKLSNLLGCLGTAKEMGAVGQKRAEELFEKSVTADHLLRLFVKCGAVPVGLAMARGEKKPLWLSLGKRVRRQFFGKPAKVRDQGFDVAGFVGSAERDA